MIALNPFHVQFHPMLISYSSSIHLIVYIVQMSIHVPADGHVDISEFLTQWGSLKKQPSGTIDVSVSVPGGSATNGSSVNAGTQVG